MANERRRRPAYLVVGALIAAGSIAVVAQACAGPDGAAPDGDGDSGDGDNSNNNDAELLAYTDAGIPDRPDPPTAVEACFPIAPVADADLPRCTAATRDCVAACPNDDTGDACRNACWASDPTPASAAGLDCPGCVFTQLLACFDQNGCHDAVATHFCCVVDACQAAGGAPGCDQACGDTANAMFTCGFVTAPQCVDLVGGAVGACYAAADEEPPPPDDVVDAGPADADGGP